MMINVSWRRPGDDECTQKEVHHRGHVRIGKNRPEADLTALPAICIALTVTRIANWSRCLTADLAGRDVEDVVNRSISIFVSIIAHPSTGEPEVHGKQAG
jgi:hypothetical protein